MRRAIIELCARFWPPGSGWRGSDRTRGAATRFFPRPDRNSQFPKPHLPRQPVYSSFHGCPAGRDAGNDLWRFEAPGGDRSGSCSGRNPWLFGHHGSGDVLGGKSRSTRRRHVRGQQFRRARHSARLQRSSHDQRGQRAHGCLSRTGSPGSPSADRPDTNRVDGIFLRWPHGSLGKPPSASSNATVRDRRALQPISRFIPQAVTSGSPMKIGWATRRSGSSMAQPTKRRSSAVAGSTSPGCATRARTWRLFEYAGAKHWFDNADLANRQTPTGVLNYSNCTFLERDDKIIDAATGDLAGTKLALRRVGGVLWL